MSDKILHLLNRAQALFDVGNYTGCEKLLLKIKRTTPDNAQILIMLGNIALNRKNFSNAERLLLEAIQKDPGNPNAYYSLGLVYGQTQLHDRAINCYRKAVSINPNFANAHTNLSMVLTKKGQYDLAVVHAENAAKLAPDDATVNNNLGVAYEHLGRYSRALECYKKAQAAQPGSVAILENLATIYVVLDQNDDAQACYRKIQSLKPDHGEAYRGLVGLKKYTDANDPDALRIRKILDRTKLSDTDRAQLLFALAKIYDDSGAYDMAFATLQQGNDIIDGQMNLDMETLRAYVDAHISTFTEDFFASRPDFGLTEKLPVFVLGMPRSGTSLVEAILDSHSLVYGAGELDWFDQLASALPGLTGTGKKIAYPECVTHLDAKTVRNLGEKYIAYLAMLSRGSTYVVNKLPANFQRLGLIRLLFPKAKIIHCHRDPMDTCLSIYSRLFPNSLPWSYNLRKLGQYYVEYERLMKNWHAAIPGNYIFDVRYEDLVADQKNITQSLLEFIGLPWEESCLNYYKNKRGVRTASSQQVKQPVYSSSIGRWKPYEKHLGPLMEVLATLDNCK